MNCRTAGLLVVSLLFFSCDSSPPELQQLYWQLNIVSNAENGAVYESLSLWVQAADEDGQDDIEFIYIINDEHELVWELSAENWQKTAQSGETWFGTNDAASADQSELPRGEYRIVLVDTAGERDERSFYLSTGKNLLQHATLPVVQIRDGKITVRDAPYGYEIWGYRGDGTFIQSSKTLNTEFVLDDAEGELANLEQFHVYTYDLNQGFGVIAGPFHTGGEALPAGE